MPLTLPVVWTGARMRGVALEALPRWLSEGPARLAGLADRKGAIAAGYDADLVIFDPDREMIVDASRLYHRHALTPYDGARLKGVVLATMLRGEIVFEHGECIGPHTGHTLGAL